MTQCPSFSDLSFSKILLNLDNQSQVPVHIAGHRNYFGDAELSPWQDHGNREGQSSVSARSGSDLTKAAPTLNRERTRPERMTSASSWTVTPRWEGIARRHYEQQRTAAGLDPGLSYFRHFVDADPALSMRSYRRRCTAEDTGNSVLTFDLLNEDEDPYLRKFRISGDLDERVRLLMLISNPSSMATACSSVSASNLRLQSTTKGSVQEPTEQRSRTRRRDLPSPHPSSSFPIQRPQSPAVPPLHTPKSTISASFPVRVVPSQPSDAGLRSSSNTGSARPADDCTDRMTSFKEAMISYVRDTQRPLLAARSGQGPGLSSDGTRPFIRQHSLVAKGPTGHKSNVLISPGTQRTPSVVADFRTTLTGGGRTDSGNVGRKRAESSRAVLARYVLRPRMMGPGAVSGSVRKGYMRSTCSSRITGGVPFQGGNDSTLFVRLG